MAFAEKNRELMDDRAAPEGPQGPNEAMNEDLECEDEDIEYAIDDQPQMVRPPGSESN